MNRYKLHILYEHGPNLQPFGGSYIRLLRPLTHPKLQQHFDVSSDVHYDEQPVDAVIVDRLWRPDISLEIAESLLQTIRKAGARLIFAMDDNLLALTAETKKDWDPTSQRLAVVRFFLAEADGVLVTTPLLKEQLESFNTNIGIVPNALDERLLPVWQPPKDNSTAYTKKTNLLDLSNVMSKLGMPLQKRRKIIGYMGTKTHDNDLMMILPALKKASETVNSTVEFHLLGAIDRPETRSVLENLPIRVVYHPLKRSEYNAFLPWFSSKFHWDIGIAPLQDTPFNRCKSDIKFLDYCAVGCVGIYSEGPAYQSTVRHQETGWLAKNTTEAWTQALVTLLNDNALRQRLAQQSTHYLFSERVVGRCLDNWVDGFRVLLEG